MQKRTGVVFVKGRRSNKSRSPAVALTATTTTVVVPLSTSICRLCVCVYISLTPPTCASERMEWNGSLHKAPHYNQYAQTQVGEGGWFLLGRVFVYRYTAVG